MADISRAEALWWKLTVVLVGLFAVTLIGWLIDDRVIDRESVWAKPLKFEASLAIHFATLAIALNAVSETSRWGSVVWAAAVASTAATVFEMLYILLQAARQQPSHFNLSSGFYTAMYVAMAAGAVVITTAAGITGGAVLAGAKPGVAPAVRWGLALGLVGGTLLTLVTAFRMGGALNHHNGIEVTGGLRMPITGWSLTVGDRRVPHFLATHLMQALPIAGAVAASVVSPAIALVGVFAFGVLWTAATLITFAQANAGVPLTQWPFH
ncbi:MAG: hypothetical protein J0I29_02235 [Rhizobiales bacterium]|nr:hypothetical protein [Hyphomicrobiales bacterium]